MVADHDDRVSSRSHSSRSADAQPVGHGTSSGSGNCCADTVSSRPLVEVRAPSDREHGDGSRVGPRHPEKAKRTETPLLSKPSWLKVSLSTSPDYFETRRVVRDHGLATVCEEANCPNIGECWSKKHATFMIMGDICTRSCAFCNVRTGLPRPLDPDEPRRVGAAVARLGLQHVVITSVDRDDLPDGGAKHFSRVVEAIKQKSLDVTIEVLTPDFRNKPNMIGTIVASKPDIFNHNIETVPRLYSTIRPGARYFGSLRLLQQVKETDSRMFTKSGLMVGLGESREEILQVMDDLRAANVDFLTVGQYLQPTRKHAEVKSFMAPEEFAILERIAYSKGFTMVSASPFTRSSYHAGEDFNRLRQAVISAPGGQSL